LSYGIPFLAARTGGIPELIDPVDRDKVLFDDLSAALTNVLEHGGWIARAAVSQDETRRSWRAMHANWKTFLPKRDEPKWRGLRAVALIDHRQGCDLDATLKSLE